MGYATGQVYHWEHETPSSSVVGEDRVPSPTGHLKSNASRRHPSEVSGFDDFGKLED